MYKLHTDEQFWTVTTFNEEMEMEERRATDIVDDAISYNWITSEDRDDVLKVMDFCQGEEIITYLKEGNLEDFEEAEEKYEYAEIRGERPTQ